MRISIFEKYKKSKVDFKADCIKIRELVLNNKMYVDHFFETSKVNYFGACFMDAISKIVDKLFQMFIFALIFKNTKRI